MNKKILLVFGTFLTVLMMFSSAVGVSVNNKSNIYDNDDFKTQDISKDAEIKGLSVSENVRLYWFMLPVLETASKSTENEKDSRILKLLCNGLRLDSILDSNEIYEILDKSNIKNTEIFSSDIDCRIRVEDYRSLNAGGWPSIGFHRRFCFAPRVWWDYDYPGPNQDVSFRFKINGISYKKTQDFSGTAYGFLEHWDYFILMQNSLTVWAQLEIEGHAWLVII